MKRRFYICFIWADPSCNGINPEWQQLTGREYFAIKDSLKCAGRDIAELKSTERDGSDGIIFIEATKAIYDEVRKETNHSDYLRREEEKSGFKNIPYETLGTADTDYNGGKDIADDMNVDEEYIKQEMSEQLFKAFMQLSEEERKLIYFLFFTGDTNSDRKYSDITGIPRRTVAHRKAKAFAKMKKFLENFEI
jgi:DNA-directed RNA polymerase specialized sigma24 family protein